MLPEFQLQQLARSIQFIRELAERQSAFNFDYAEGVTKGLTVAADHFQTVLANLDILHIKILQHDQANTEL